ncbi:hydroxyacid dehydrogenase [Oleiagrimonas sp.]|jgi:(S)-sulfolactate dehydrogenase|uniref:hydroxyacid dehydrogenase n=1 Tax=Oleiagrimonas sp. TaxID=2010330 RepID=UPI00260C49E3|nr:hydroxyacid dehydrogenase [Oleiagrimonas sp.]MDA3913733.1 hydroxyacid dehydrogenase [Oleiagrimonas sp.]
MADIVISEFMDEMVISKVFADHDVLYDPTLVDRTHELHAALAEARAVIVRNRTQVRASLLEAAQKLRVVGRLGVGLDNIDVPACKARGIAVHPAKNANDQAVAEYVVSCALQLLRGAYAATNQLIAGQWPRMELIGRELAGTSMGLVGFGAIAQAVALRVQALGMNVLAFDPYLPKDHAAWKNVQSGSLEEILQKSDVISLHVPLTKETRHMIDAKALGMMRARAILINASRGGVVDENALAASLREGRLAGAALDVFEREPLDAETASVFTGLENLILTPHIAGVTEQSNIRVSEVTAQNVLKYLD